LLVVPKTVFIAVLDDVISS